MHQIVVEANIGAGGVILLILSFVLLAALAKSGHPMPSTSQKRRIRRNAREKGITQQAAFDQWSDKERRRKGSSDPMAFEYFADTRPKKEAAPTPEKLRAQAPSAPPLQIIEAADEPLRLMASARNLSLLKQRNGHYILVKPDGRSGALLTNPFNPNTFDFTRDDVERFLSPREGGLSQNSKSTT
jgi:hypothetical protein